VRWHTAGLALQGDVFFFYSISRNEMSFSSFIDEFIYAGHPGSAPFGPVFACSNPPLANLVIYSDKRNEAEKSQ